jgi:hypothetical protein
VPIPPEVRSHVEEVLREYLELSPDEPIEWDEDDGISINWLETDLSVWILDHQPPLLRVSARMLKEVSDSPDLLAAINELNSGIVSTRVVKLDDNIIAAFEVPADSITTSELAYMLWSVGTATSGNVPDLQARFGGRLHSD